MKPSLGIILAVLLMIGFAVIVAHPAAYLAAFIWFIVGAALSLVGDGKRETIAPEPKAVKTRSNRLGRA